VTRPMGGREGCSIEKKAMVSSRMARFDHGRLEPGLPLISFAQPEDGGNKRTHIQAPTSTRLVRTRKEYPLRPGREFNCFFAAACSIKGAGAVRVTCSTSFWRSSQPIATCFFFASPQPRGSTGHDYCRGRATETVKCRSAAAVDHGEIHLRVAAISFRWTIVALDDAERDARRAFDRPPRQPRRDHEELTSEPAPAPPGPTAVPQRMDVFPDLIDLRTDARRYSPAGGGRLRSAPLPRPVRMKQLGAQLQFEQLDLTA